MQGEESQLLEHRWHNSRTPSPITSPVHCTHGFGGLTIQCFNLITKSRQPKRSPAGKQIGADMAPVSRAGVTQSHGVMERRQPAAPFQENTVSQGSKLIIKNLARDSKLTCGHPINCPQKSRAREGSTLTGTSRMRLSSWCGRGGLKDHPVPPIGPSSPLTIWQMVKQNISSIRVKESFPSISWST